MHWKALFSMSSKEKEFKCPNSYLRSEEKHLKKKKDEMIIYAC
jgi:hypothetical protein